MSEFYIIIGILSFSLISAIFVAALNAFVASLAGLNMKNNIKTNDIKIIFWINIIVQTIIVTFIFGFRNINFEPYSHSTSTLIKLIITFLAIIAEYILYYKFLENRKKWIIISLILTKAIPIAFGLYIGLSKYHL